MERYTKINELFAQLLSREASEIIGRLHPLLQIKETATPNLKAAISAIHQNISWQGSHRDIFTGSSRFSYFTQIFPLSNPDSSKRLLCLHHPLKENEMAIYKQDSLVQELKNQLAAVDRSVAAVEFDLYGHILAANQNFLKIVGYSLEEIVGQHHKIFMFPEDSAKIEYQRFWQELALGQSKSGIFKRKNKKGKPTWIIGSYNPIFDSNGQPYKLIKYVLDITRQKELEQELHIALETAQAQEEEVRQQMEEIAAINDKLSEVQAELQSQLNAINRSNAVVEFDLRGHILNANENFLKTVGYAKEEILGKHHRIFMFPEDAETEAYQKFWQTLGEGSYVSGVFRRKAKDGTERWIMGSYNPLYDKNGKVYKLIKFVYDVTREKRQEYELQRAFEEKTQQEEEIRQQMEEIAAINEKLSEVQAELQSQLNAINRSNAVVEFDLSGHILNANENFLKTVGYTKEEILGKHHRIFMFPEDAETEAYQKFWQTLGAGNYVSGVFRRKAKDGTERWIMGSYNPLYDKNGKVYKLIKFVYDVTHEKRQECELQSTLSEIQESIVYAQRIQQAIIPEPAFLNKALPPNYQSSIFFKPRDVVSGDFYWIGNWKRRTVLVGETGADTACRAL